MSQSSSKKFKLSSLAGIFIEVLQNDDKETKPICWRDQDASSQVKVTLKSSSLLDVPEPQFMAEAYEEEEDANDVKVKCESPEVVIIEDWMMSESNHNDDRMDKLWRVGYKSTPQRRNRRFPSLGHKGQGKVMRKNLVSSMTAAADSFTCDKQFVMKMQKKWNVKKGIRRRMLSAYQDTSKRYACQKCHKYFLRFQDMWKHRVNLCGLAFKSSQSCEFFSKASNEFHAQDQNVINRVENCVKENCVFRFPALPPKCKQVTEKAVSGVFGSSLLQRAKMGSNQGLIDSFNSCDTEEDDERFLCRYPSCGVLFDELSELHWHILQAHELYACKYCESLVKTSEELDQHLKRRHDDLMEDKDRPILEFEPPAAKVCQRNPSLLRPILEFEPPAEKVRQRNLLPLNALQSSSTFKRPRSSEGRTHSRTKTPRRSNSKESNELGCSGRGPIGLNGGTVVDKRRPPRIQQSVVQNFRRISDQLGLCTDLRKGYQCNQCPMSFTRESSLKSHMKTGHGDGGSDTSNMSAASSVSSSRGESSSEVEEPVPIRSLRSRSIPTVSSFSEVSSAGSTTTNASISSSLRFSTRNLQHRTKIHLAKESPDRVDLNVPKGNVNARDSSPFVPKPSRQDDLRSLSGPFMCNDCGVEFPLKDELTDHLVWHNDMKGQNKIFRGLRKTGIAGSAMKYPDATSEADPLFKCMVCGGDFYNYQAMKEHVKTRHTRNGRYKCMDCGQVFLKAMVLVTHYELKHDPLPPQLDKVIIQEAVSNPVPNMASPGKLPQVQGPAKTDIRKSTTPIKLVQRPTTVGSRNKPTHVGIPDKSVNGLLSKTLATLSPRPQRTKNQASKKISSAKSLKYPCKYIECGERFETIEELRDHWHSAHSPLMKFFCTYPNCGYPVAVKDGLLPHMRDHKGWKPE